MSESIFKEGMGDPKSFANYLESKICMALKKAKPVLE